ncbi:hypothetical protein [Dyadobacter bucti]|uniref:hypothetical protein n=1 Tax=Dyadobacter bucti TaxID=2572203 RepID=UPI003F723265
MKYLIVVLLSSFFAGCNNNPNCPAGTHKTITISNKSSKRIYYMIYWNYPDTTIGAYNAVHSNKHFNPGDAFERTVSPNGSDGCWEEILARSGKENIYFFDADIIEKTNWEDVKKNSTGLLERREIDLDYCIRNNWEIVYR